MNQLSQIYWPDRNVSKVSDTQIKITLSAPMLFYPTLTLVSILNKEVYDATDGNYGDDRLEQAFKIVEHVTGSKTYSKTR